ncbi:Fic family protein [Acidovorax sp. SUPP2825]|uniref:Fic family protein n=1 Tax=Acidovorax sp. SUPP2825 TaxID=2920879 RepID=UPI0023DE5B32|nr:Fic family protein [Acidovorax sp. SUPP2825]GKS95431.1 Fic family protein [Acidovorax sp. SUPP2825]
MPARAGARGSRLAPSAPRQAFALEPRGPAMDRLRMSETAARVLAEPGADRMMSPSLRMSSAFRVDIGPPIPESKTLQRAMLEDFLRDWAGPQTVKDRILKAHRKDDFVLNLDKADLNSLPQGLFLLPHLGHISLNRNPLLRELPSDLAHAPGLLRIQANDCDLQCLPENLGQAAKLVVLEVGNNRGLTALPESMSALTELQVLQAQDCDLVRLPRGGLGPAVKDIDLGNNPRLTGLPDAIDQSPRIERLMLNQCALSRLPSAVGHLPRLNALDVSGNPGLQHLPEGIDFKHVHIATRGTQIRLMDRVLSQPLDPQVRAAQEGRVQQVRARWSAVRERLEAGGLGAAQQAQAARLEIDRARMGLSSTVESMPLAGDNWNAADRQVREWIAQNEPLDTEHLKRLNALLGQGTWPFDDPEAFEKFGARFGAFRRQSTGFSQGQAGAAVVDEREVGAEMAHFDDWFEAAGRRVERGESSPAEWAAATVQRLISIHPFPDANGRTARLAGDWVLMGQGLPPTSSPKQLIAVFSSGRNPVGPEDALALTVEGMARTVEVYERHLGLEPRAEGHASGAAH